MISIKEYYWGCVHQRFGCSLPWLSCLRLKGAVCVVGRLWGWTEGGLSWRRVSSLSLLQQLGNGCRFMWLKSTCCKLIYPRNRPTSPSLIKYLIPNHCIWRDPFSFPHNTIYWHSIFQPLYNFFQWNNSKWDGFTSLLNDWPTWSHGADVCLTPLTIILNNLNKPYKIV